MAPLPRSLVPELMDDPALGEAEHLRALRGLARLNRWSRSSAILWRHIKPLLRAQRPLRVLDIATGSADIPLALAARARRAGFAIEIDACDASPTALGEARRAADACGLTLRTHRVDATADELPASDVATCSLFMHHLDDAAAVAVLRRMTAAAPAVLVSDLRRCRRGLAVAWAASRLLSSSPIVHADAVLSARAAYTPQELDALATRAGLAGFTIRHAWPFRMLLRWNAPR